MKRVVTCACLIASVLSAFAEEEEVQPQGVPWIIHSEFGGYNLLKAPKNSPGQEGYQLRFLNGLTAQPWSLVLLHAAWMYRETQAPGFSKPYREPMLWEGSGTVELLPGLLFAWFGVNWPTSSESAPLGDSTAWSAFLNDHPSLPDAGILAPTSVQIGGAARIQSDPNLFLAGLSYQRASTFKGMQENHFRPPWILRLTFRCDIPLSNARQRLDLSGTLFGAEETEDVHQAHVEGALMQMRYSAWGLGGDGRWATALGLSAKLRDANRRVMLDIPPETMKSNDNLQSLHFEIARNLQATWRRFGFTVSNHLEAQWRPKDGTVYVENALEWRLFRRVFRGHGLELRFRGLAGESDGAGYYGAGATVLFTFRHLGVEDSLTASTATPP